MVWKVVDSSPSRAAAGWRLWFTFVGEGVEVWKGVFNLLSWGVNYPYGKGRGGMGELELHVFIPGRCVGVGYSVFRIRCLLQWELRGLYNTVPGIYSEAMCMRVCISWGPIMRVLGDIFLDDREGSWGIRVYYFAADI